MDILIMAEKFDNVIEIMKDNDEVANKTMICALIDWVAGTVGKRGYEFVDELLPAMKGVGDKLGVFADD